MHHHRVLCFAAFWVTALCGCQTSASRQQWDLAVKQGKASNPRDPVLLHTVALVDPDPSVGQFCTGVVIGKRQILTSAHCFDDEQRIPYVLMERSYEPGLDYSERATLFRIELAAIHSGYQNAKSDAYDKQVLSTSDAKKVSGPGKPLHDLAVAVLEHDVIDPYRPVKFVTGTEDLKTSRILAAGYGCQGADCDETESELRKSEMKFVKNLADAPLVVLSGGGGKGTCLGDRGGPDFRVEPQALSLLAIKTTGQGSCEAGVAVDTLVLPYKAWIEKGLDVLSKPMVQVEGFRVVDFTHSDENGED